MSAKLTVTEGVIFPKLWTLIVKHLNLVDWCVLLIEFFSDRRKANRGIGLFMYSPAPRNVSGRVLLGRLRLPRGALPHHPSRAPALHPPG